MLEGLRTVVYSVPDRDAAKAWYTEMLGKTPYFDEPFYVGFNVGGYELGLLPSETRLLAAQASWKFVLGPRRTTRPLGSVICGMMTSTTSFH